MIKRYIVFAFIALFILSTFVSCSGGGETLDNDGIKIVVTVFPQYDFVRNITSGTDAEITMLLKTGNEPHSYEPTPADIKALSKCDLFIWVGGESEAWADKLIDSASVPSDRVMALMDIVPLIEGSHEGEYDEHVWTSPKNAMLIVEALSEKLCEIDVGNKDAYKLNSDRYISELSELDGKFCELVGRSSDRTLIIGDRFPFAYLADAYDFKYASPFKGCSSHTEPSVSDVAGVIEIAKEEAAKVVFSVDFSNEKLAGTIADEVGAEIKRLYSCHTVSASDFENGIGYIDLMLQNLKNIEEAIGQKSEK
ncbi:MAG: zinc ABC transporter substrate-binding protein [Clostridia bacterium]|nr:zinc ABC transporter substrate-binding protein [Clostridia bacterium]